MSPEKRTDPYESLARASSDEFESNDHEESDVHMASTQSVPAQSVPAQSASAPMQSAGTMPNAFSADISETVTALCGRFRSEGEIRTGGMARVLRAIDQQTGAVVAVKLLHTASVGSDAALRFEREAHLLATLEHPALVQYVDHGWEKGEPYLVMEWLDGKDLEHRLSELGLSVPSASLSIEAVLTLGYRLASVTALLHERGIVHRDIKPGNVFLVDGRIDQCKLIDLGVARLGEAETTLTHQGALVGTPAYMAPEQAEPKGELGPATDVWAIGCVLYECLTRRQAFHGHNLMAVLAKIVVEQPTPIAELRPDVPPELASLIEAMLVKDPKARIPDGKALVRALEGLRGSTRSQPTRHPSTPPPNDSLTMGEQRFGCVLLAQASGPVGTKAITRAVIERGGKLAALRDGSYLIMPHRAISVRDDALRVAHIASAVRQIGPRLRMAMTVGQVRAAASSLSTGQEARSSSWGAAIDDLARAITITPQGQIHVDSATAALIETHFEVAREGACFHLGARRAAEETRTLLGRPIGWVGRRRELLTLTSLYDEVCGEFTARALVMTAPAGMGKTRLRTEFVKHLHDDGHQFELLLAQGDSLSAGSPFVMLGPAVRRLAGISEGESAALRERQLRQRLATTVPGAELDRIAAFIGEMVGVPNQGEIDDSLRAARKDPMLMGELMRQAWEDWLGYECAAHPVVIVLEDLHWGDVPSVKFIDAALARLAKERLLVIALARPELDEVFPKMWSKREPERLRLRALSDDASRKLVTRALGEAVSPDVVTMIVERAEGNAFFLEELIRMVAEGAKGHLPATVLSMVQSRLDAFGSDAKRLLRAASIFGEVFWRGGLQALLGAVRNAFSIEECLEDLVRAEVITKRPHSRIDGDTEYKFRHALLRDGAYETLTSDDRRLGHRLAAEWLEAVGERDPLVLAEHCTRGHDLEAAARWFYRAAGQALEANDLETVLRYCERAVTCRPTGAALGAILALAANAAYWRSDYERASHDGREAVPLLAPGSAQWFQAISSLIVSNARLGDYDAVYEWFDTALAQNAHENALAEQLICLCRGTFQLIFHGRFDKADEVLERIASLMNHTAEMDALTWAQANHVRGVRAAHVGDVATFMHHLQAAIEGFTRAGDARNVRLETTTLAWCYAELGDFAEAERICRDNMRSCCQLNAQQAVTYGKVNLGYILIGCPNALDEAATVLREAIEECGDVANLRLEGWARVHLSTVEYLRGHREAAESHAAVAVDLLAVCPGLKAWALAAHARAVLDDDAPRALDEARESMAILNRLGGLLQGESLPPLMLAKAYRSVGDGEAAWEAIEDARERMLKRAERLGKEAWKQSFLELPDNRETFELWHAWTRERSALLR